MKWRFESSKSFILSTYRIGCYKLIMEYSMHSIWQQLTCQVCSVVIRLIIDTYSCLLHRKLLCYTCSPDLAVSYKYFLANTKASFLFWRYTGKQWVIVPYIVLCKNYSTQITFITLIILKEMHQRFCVWKIMMICEIQLFLHDLKTNYKSRYHVCVTYIGRCN